MRERGYGPIRIRGKFGNKERSMIIPNITREDMVRLDYILTKSQSSGEQRQAKIQVCF